MWAFFRALFGTDFMPHLYCLRGDPGVLWLQVISDLAIAVAYYAIPLVLFDVVRRRKDILFRKMALLFVLFIAACGTTHLLSVWTIWHPMYRLEGVTKAVTAILSVTTAIVLVWLLPVIRQLPSVAELEAEIVERRRAEEESKIREQRFRNFVDGVQDYAIYTLDTKGYITGWNSGAERIKGYSGEEIIGQHFSRFFPPRELYQATPEDSLRIAVETGKFDGEGWRVRKDGSRFWANVIIRPMRDSAGELIGFSKITRDLSESRDMEAKFQTLLEAAPDAILIVNPQGLIEFANAQVERLFGYCKTEVLGRSVDTLVPMHARAEHAGHRQRFFQTPKTREMGLGRDLLGLRKDGTEFSVEISLSPLATKDGPVVMAAVRDVSERKKAEMRFRALLDSAPDAMVISGSNGLIELTNLQAERIFGYAREEMIGQPVEILIPSDLQAAYQEDRPGIFSGETERKIGEGLDLRVRRKDGTEFPVEISFSPLEGLNGTSVTAAIRDTTDRKHAAKLLAEKMTELKHSNESLEQFAHIASHDLQEPLRMVASYTQLLAKRYKGRLDSDADEFIAYAVDGTQRMKRLIEDLLLYSRAGKGTPPMEEFASEGAIQEALHNVRKALEESGGHVTHDAMPVIVGARLQLVQLFQNLISNAIKYRGERRPEIHVSAREEAKEWIFSVADNGIGIAPQYFERIFAIFERLHGREEYEGTGVGLAICKRILQQLGGRIWVESEPGRGSVFHFSLPRGEG